MIPLNPVSEKAYSKKSRTVTHTASSTVRRGLLSLTVLCFSFVVGTAQTSAHSSAHLTVDQNAINQVAAKKDLASKNVFSKDVTSQSVNQLVTQAISKTASSGARSEDFAITKELAVLEDGTYLFGQSPQRDQVGSSYIVFSVRGNEAVGAFYQPNSSFDCFSGQVYPDRMALNVVDSYRQTVHPYSVALTTDGSLTAGSAASAYTLQGFHRIENLSSQDLEILAVCEADID